MSNRVELDDNLDGRVRAATADWLDTRLGPDIADDARRYCPERTGALRSSIEHHVEGDDLIVSATGSDERTYAAYVELGHRVYHPSTGVTGPEVVPPQPFLRPALYRQRGD
jgi:hypothetical protein